MTLSESPPVPYSPAEKRLFRILSTGRKTTNAIMKTYYGGEAPTNARRSIAVGLASLRRKVDRNREPFRIRTTQRSGPISMYHWVEPRR